MANGMQIARPGAAPRPAPSAIDRARLLGRLLAGAFRVTLIAGPAGSGKTVLARQWSEATADPVAWLDVTPDDRRPGRLAGRLSLALATLDSGLLILDDVHLLAGSAGMAALRDLLHPVPDGVVVGLCSRTWPDLSLHRLDLTDDLLVLGRDELPFSREETRALLTSWPGVEVLPRHVDALHGRTGGWAAGLHVTARALSDRRGTDVDEVLAHVPDHDRQLADILGRDLFDALDPDMQRFVLRTSVLDRLSAPVCEAVAHDERSEWRLAQLDVEELLLVPVDDPDESYRWPPLVASFLRREHRRRHPGDVALRHRRAARWFAANGDAPTAVDHLIAAGHHDAALDTVMALGPEVDPLVRSRALDRWVDRAPPAVRARRPEASLLGTVARFGADAGGVTVPRARADASPDQAVRAPRLRPLADAVRAVGLVSRGDARAALAAGERAHRHRDDEDGLAASRIELGARDLWSHLPVALARAAALLEDPDAVQSWADAFEEVGSARYGDRVALLGAQAWCAARHARLREATARASAALDHAADHGHDRVASTVDAHLTLGAVARERDQGDEAERSLVTAVEVGLAHEQHGSVALAQLERARAASARGAHDDAFALVVAASRPPHGWPLPTPLRTAVAVVAARVHLAAGDRDGADGLLSRLPPGPDRTLLEARLHRAHGLPERALPLVEVVLEQADLGPRLRLVASVLASGLERELGDVPAARSHLARITPLTMREGHVRLFLDEGIDHIEVVGDAANAPPARNPWWRPHVDGLSTGPLSDRELEVLRYLRGRLDNREIGGLMFISVNTVKTHLQSIYRKLGVESRTEAVRRAREVGLL